MSDELKSDGAKIRFLAEKVVELLDYVAKLEIEIQNLRRALGRTRAEWFRTRASRM